MPDDATADRTPDARPGNAGDVGADLVRLMSRDLLFTMRFMGESQYRLQSHFQDFIRDELAAGGVTQETHPMIHLFIEAHAILLRDFVFAGVSLSRQFRVEEIEKMSGDTMIRVDIWDQLKNHIDTAETQFRSQAGSLPGLLTGFEMPSPPAPGGGR